MKKQEQNIEEYNIIFEKLAEAKDEQKVNVGLSDSDYSDIHESVQKLQEIQQSIDSSSYTYFTRS
jgi:vacuolar-type H+-ATPase subunit C/Vma6